MGIFGSMFQGRKPDAGSAHLDRLTHALRTQLNLLVVPPPPDVEAVIAGMTDRELAQFDNMQTVAGMKSLFHARSIRALVDAVASTVTLTIESQTAAPTEAPPPPPARRIGLSERKASVHITPPAAPDTPTPAISVPALVFAPVPAGLEHLEALEELLPQLADLFVRHGKLTTGDKDVLKAIKPTDGSPAARLVSLERWQGELTRRVRGFTVPRAQQHLVLGGNMAPAAEKPQAGLPRRFDAVLTWVAKLIKAFEHTGVRYHNKPIWLQH